MFTYSETYPTEIYRIGKREVMVVRADLVPDPPLPPYLKMIELLRFVDHLKQTVNPEVIGYYAQDSSDWTRIIPSVCKQFGIRGMVGFAKKKEIPDFIRSIGENVYWLSPNMYNVNWARMRKYIEGFRNGFMLPMGVDHPFVVKSIQDYFDNASLPEADTYIVPVGSGVALSGIARHLDKREQADVMGICTRPTKSVKKVVDKHLKPKKIRLSLIEGPDTDLINMPFPGHRFWERRTWTWLVNNIKYLEGRLCYINLGS